MMSDTPVASTPPVTIADSELRQIRSSIVGEEYLIKIRLPESYAESTSLYPVLYLLDGDHAFAMATDIVQYLLYGGHIPDMIIVSPAYGSKVWPRGGGTNMRERDLVPFETEYSDLPPGGEQYLGFIQQELIPYVERVYRIDGSQRVLWGYSLGALFALYVLFEEPELFQKYIVVDGFHDKLLEIEERYAAHNNALPARLFLASGFDMSGFHERLRSRNYEGLELMYERLSDLGHFAVGAEGLTKGLLGAFHDFERD